ncbi:MAG TPA: bifunctional 4-hydroxy-2-oxoglutarate aldolase/2-dehydro-3-deoxy-phosphogluconate aldolase [Candidatus Omnitrophota bacterium]|nr:bifunctional 4-hydroxy-2-oxoglutarate aldolase/2-dehydro-3-deoxy-phosphogluconate aldolase [Candidatus Omnitrophota bacterium]
MNIQKFKQLPLMGILRGVTADQLEALMPAVLSSGLRTLEITMNTKGAAELIRKARNLSKGRLMIGAGTVMTMKDLRQAIDAGATFIVSPVLIKDTAKYCVKHRIPYFPGALTPQEIYRAWEMGASMVKIFPAKLYGPEYFREIKGPLNEVELLACGGVTLGNLPDFFANGADAVTLGAGVFRKEWLQAKDFKKIGHCIKTFIHAYLAFRLKNSKMGAR